MNPIGILVVALGIVIIIIGVKGSQHGVLSAFTNLAPKAS